MAPRLQLHRSAAALTLLVLTASVFVTMFAVPSPPRAASETPTGYVLYDNFTQDTKLNTALWQINGSVGVAYGLDDVGIQSVLLAPTFSSMGMKIAQINASYTAGTIQSIESFTPPFTAIAVVEGTVSHGHTFGFAIASTNASSGVAMIGNLNSTDCSSLGNCGDPATCGISPNPTTIPSNQCYYGIFARVANGRGKWAKIEPKLDLTPSVGTYYTLQISVDASGSAQYSVSQGGHVINESTTQVGSGPFYVVIEQGEGAPVPGHGPNQAYWASVAVAPSAISVSTSSSTQTSPATPLKGIPTLIWIIIVIVIILLLIFFLLYGRRRGFVVAVLDSGTSSPISRASVTATGPKNLSGATRANGKVDFGTVKDGDYKVSASAAGYNPSTPVAVRVERRTKYSMKLDRLAPIDQGGVGGNAPPAGPSISAAMAPTSIPQNQHGQEGVAEPFKPEPTRAMTQPASVAPSGQGGPDEFEGWGGGRIREIVKTFQAKGAISPETAMTAEELGLSRLFVRIMKRRKGKTMIFMEVNGKYYLNQKAVQDS